MVIVTISVNVIVDIINILVCVTKLKMKFHFGIPDLELIKEIFSFSVFIAINQIIDQINWATDKVVLGKYCTSAAVAYYAIGAQINTYFTQFSSAISSVFSPQIYRIESSSLNEEEKNKQHTILFIKVGRIQFLVLFLILSGFIVFGESFISFWAGPDYTSSFFVALLLMCPAIVPLIQNCGIEIQQSKNKHQFRSIVYLMMAIVNVMISIHFAKKWGEIGAAAGTTISLLIANGVIMNIYYQKAIGINVLLFWKKILQFFPALLLPISVGLIIKTLHLINGLKSFVLLLLLYVFIYCISVFLIGLDKEEKDKIISIMKKINLKRKY